MGHLTWPVRYIPVDALLQSACPLHLHGSSRSPALSNIYIVTSRPPLPISDWQRACSVRGISFEEISRTLPCLVPLLVHDAHQTARHHGARLATCLRQGRPAPGALAASVVIIIGLRKLRASARFHAPACTSGCSTGPHEGSRMLGALSLHNFQSTATSLSVG